MEIRLAKTAGFCFGVDRAVKLTYGLLDEGRKVATLGPLIHNPQTVEDLERRGALVADTPADVPAGYEVVIRSHGVPRSIYDELDARGCTYHDATCPFVKKIQKVASEAEAAGATLVVAGDVSHPEVQGIVGHTRGEVFVFSDLDQLKAWKGPSDPQKPIFAVAQTTFQVTKWQESSEFLKKAYTNARIFDTICNATWARQQEAEDLSQQCDIIVVIGGHHSSNTQKLVQVAAKHTRAVTVETASELRPEWFADVKTAGVTAGASTPSSIIEEVLNSMSAEINDSMSFEEMLNASEEKRVHAGSIVKGIVTSISANEIQVDIGAKQTGFVKLSELTDDSSAKVEDLVKVGDELDLIVEKVMDQDGVIQLSRKKLASRKGMEEIAKAAESGEVVEGDVTEFNKGGVVVNVKGVKVFVPRSQATMRRDEDYTALVGQHVQLVVTECSGRKIVGSINKVTAEQNKAKREEFWANVEVGKTYTGVVKSLTSYGAFVDIGGVDGLCHISELSWNRIKHPSEVVNIGDTVEVYIKEIDPEKKRISLGYRKDEDNPWEILKKDYPVGTDCDVTIVGLTTFGAFARIIPGIDGLIHISDLSWTKKIKHPSEFTQIDAPIEVQVLEIDKENRRLSLGHKQLEENPWDVYETIYKPDTIHAGTITEVNDKGAVVALNEGGEGFAPARGLAKADGTTAAKGETLEFRVLEFGKNNRKIILSHTRTFEEAKAKEDAVKEASTQEAVKKLSSSIEKTTLGDISGLAELKAQLEGKN